MAVPKEIKVSRLPLAGPLLGSEIFVIDQGGVTCTCSFLQIGEGIPAGPPGPVGPPGPPGPGVITKDATPTAGFTGRQVLVSQTSVGPPAPAVSYWPNVTLDAQGGFTYYFSGVQVTIAAAGSPPFTVVNGPFTSGFLFDASLGVLVGQFLGRAMTFNGLVAITYVASTPADWAGGVDPADVWPALDQLAARLTAGGL